MFTGIVEERGEVVAVESLEQAARLRVRGPRVTSDAGVGDSISVNGVCLTITDVDDGVFAADVMHQSLLNSSLGALVVGSPVNLERSVTMSTRLGGHLVQGHVDGVAAIVARTHTEHWDVVEIALPADLRRYVVAKGSITVDGISLTVAVLDAETFTVSLIPTTLATTTLGVKQPGDAVNLEVDVVAKYVERLLAARESVDLPLESTAADRSNP